MKRLAFLLLFFAWNLHAFSQINYSVGIGPMVSFGKTDKDFPSKSLTTYSLHVGGEVSYRIKKLKFNIDIQLNRTYWKRMVYSPFEFKSNSRVTYLSLNPNLEFKPLKAFGVSLGLYDALNLIEKSPSRFGGWKKPRSIFNIELHAPYDYGISFGGNFYLKNHYSFGLKYNLGLVNITRTISKDDGDREIHGKLMKNRNIQLSFIYSFFAHWKKDKSKRKRK